MLNFTRTSKGLLSLALMFMLVAACSSPKYYVFKTIKHTPVEKNEVKPEAVAVNEAAQEQPGTIAAEELIVASTETLTAPLNLDKISREMTQKAVVKEEKEISKFQQIKMALQLRKEIKKMEKSLEEPQNLNPEAQAQDNPKSQLIALLLVLFAGGLGIHRFYLGYTTIGIIQLLTLGGCGIWALIDLVRIITGDLKPADGSNYDPEL